MSSKNDCPKSIAVFVAGSTPQIITETIYALAKKIPPVCPDEIIIITTTEGKKRAEETLLNKGILRKLFVELKIPEKPLQIKVAKDSSGNELEDIRTEADNEAMGNLIASIIKEKAKDKNSCLHCSIAGGRKTMSFYLGAALQLFGRPQDKLYHVLVTPEFETNPDFFYKPLKNQKIKTMDGKTLNTRDAEIICAELPFVRLGGRGQMAAASFNDVVKSGQRAIDTAAFQSMVEIDVHKSVLLIDGKKIPLSPAHLSLYAFFLQLKKQCKEKKSCAACDECYSELHDITGKHKDNVLKILSVTFKNQERGMEVLKNWKTAQTLLSYRSKINNIIAENLNNPAAGGIYQIHSLRHWSKTRYGVSIDKSKIIFR